MQSTYPQLLAALTLLGQDSVRHGAVTLLSYVTNALFFEGLHEWTRRSDEGICRAGEGDEGDGAVEGDFYLPPHHIARLFGAALIGVNDTCAQVRRLAASVFGALLRLVPLLTEEDTRALTDEAKLMSAPSPRLWSGSASGPVSASGLGSCSGLGSESGSGSGSAESAMASTAAAAGVLAHLVIGSPLPPQYSPLELASVFPTPSTLATTNSSSGGGGGGGGTPRAKATELRPYQEDGVSWLLFLVNARLHGALCDDMGLGKTLQILTMLVIHLQRTRYVQEGLYV